MCVCVRRLCESFCAFTWHSGVSAQMNERMDARQLQRCDSRVGLHRYQRWHFGLQFPPPAPRESEAQWRWRWCWRWPPHQRHIHPLPSGCQSNPRAWWCFVGVAPAGRITQTWLCTPLISISLSVSSFICPTESPDHKREWTEKSVECNN